MSRREQSSFVFTIFEREQNKQQEGTLIYHTFLDKTNIPGRNGHFAKKRLTTTVSILLKTVH